MSYAVSAAAYTKQRKFHGQNVSSFSNENKKSKRSVMQRKEFTWMVRTMRLVSSRAAIAVEVPNEAVPR